MSKPRKVQQSRTYEGRGVNTGGNAAAAPALAREKTTVSMQLPKSLDKNVNVYCAVKGITKTEYVTNTLAADLSKKGFDPYKEPQLPEQK